MQSCSLLLLYHVNLLSKFLIIINTTVGCSMPSCTLDSRKKQVFSLCHTGGVIRSALVFPGFRLQFLAMGSAFGEISLHFMPFSLSQGCVTSSQVT